MKKVILILITFILFLTGCKNSKNVKSIDAVAEDNRITAKPQVEKKHDYSKEAHLPPEGWNPLTASEDELKYYKYPSKPVDSDKLKEWKKAVMGGWYDDKTDSISVHSHLCIPCLIVWDDKVYRVDTRCGPTTGKEIGKDTDGMTVYEIPDIDSSYGIIIGFSDDDGHRATRIDYDANDAILKLLSDSSLVTEKLSNLDFPHSNSKVKTFVNRGNKKIPVQLETKIEEPKKLNYIITFTETWNTKDYSYEGCTQPIGKHFWRFRVDPNGYSEVDSGGDVPPQMK